MLKDKNVVSEVLASPKVQKQSPGQVKKVDVSAGSTMKSKGGKDKRATAMNLDLHQLTDLYPPKSRDATRRKSRGSRMRPTAKATPYINGGPDVRTMSVLQNSNPDHNISETD